MDLSFYFLTSVYFFVVVLPAVFWFGMFYFLDKDEPEPSGLLFKVFRWGMMGMLLAAAVEFALEKLAGLEAGMGGVSGEILFSNGAMALFLLSYFLAGPIEELVKYLLLRKAIYKDFHFNQIMDGVIYGITLALGFALIENTVYFFNVYKELRTADFLWIIFLRGFLATLIHLCATGIIGLYLGRMKFLHWKRIHWALRGVFLASILHGTYNLLIFFAGGVVFNFFLVVCALAFLVYQLQKDQVHWVWIFKSKKWIREDKLIKVEVEGN